MERHSRQGKRGGGTRTVANRALTESQSLRIFQKEEWHVTLVNGT